ncbi:MFS transporter [Nocardioides caeni]|uniref:MFS transporter n=1 Tax=Nocardioides caeni TaxID=574700 RepID=A0A4S8NDX4_9ACTN|nr:MFS transporter [Nocardioides caeni]THV14747.1 MFS transporter [Nocardioides caeni]
MAETRPAEAGLAPDALRRVVVVLCGTQVVSWGTLFYTLPVLAPTIAREQDWSLSLVVASFTLAQLFAAAGSVVVGRRIEARGPRAVMAGGALVGAAGLVGVATAPTLWGFAVAWAVAGSAMSAVLYPPAFAALTEWGGERRVRALTALTLVAGLASTVFAPMAAFLVTPMGWRGTYLVMASILALTAPVLWATLHHPWRASTVVVPVDGAATTTREATGAVPPTWRTPAFLRVVAALGLVGFSLWAAVFLLVPLLVERGLSTQAAALALGVGGVGQVCGRLAYARIEAASGVTARTRLVFAAVAVTTGSLAVVNGPAVALFGLSFAAGAARGVYTLVQATAVTDRWGTASYASLNGIVSAALLVAGAAAPWAGTAVAEASGSHALAFGLLTAIALAGIVVLPAGRHDRHRAARPVVS